MTETNRRPGTRIIIAVSSNKLDQASTNIKDAIFLLKTDGLITSQEEKTLRDACHNIESIKRLVKIK